MNIKKAIEITQKFKWNFLHIGNPMNLTEADRVSNNEALQTLISHAQQEPLQRKIKEQAKYIDTLKHLSANTSKMLLDLTKPNDKSHIRSHIVDHALIVSIKFKKMEAICSKFGSHKVDEGKI